MIHWKNRPISELSRDELRQALSEALHQSLSGNATPVNALSDSFFLGVLSGAAIAVAGFAISLMLV